MSETNRRDFLKSSAAAAVAGIIGAPASVGSRSGTHKADAPAIKKGLVLSMLPEKLAMDDRFKLARDTGFELVQAPTTPDPKQADEMKAAAEASGVRVDSVMNMAHWK